MNGKIRLFLDGSEEGKKVKGMLEERKIPYETIVVPLGPNAPALNFGESWYYGFFDIQFFLLTFLLKKNKK